MRSSNSFIFSAHTACSGDMLELETVRKTVSKINKINKEKERISQWRFDNGYSNNIPQKLPRYRVKTQARGPRTINALKDGKHPRAYDQSLPLRHAERLDVYVHENHTW